MIMCLLFRDSASHIVQLGLGAAALTKFCYHRLASTTVTAVELNPGVIDICRSHFALPPDNERLSVLNMDALDYVTDFSRSEERRVGKECVGTCRFRWWPYH